MKNYGTLLKKIRQDKGLSQKDIYDGIMTRQTYYLIETNVSMPSFDKFLMILEKLFISVEEFLDLLDHESFPPENNLYHQLSQAVFKKDQPVFESLIKETQEIYTMTHNKKYFHLNLVTQAMAFLNKGETDPKAFESSKKLMQPIKHYLVGIDKWYLYELKLLNNSLYCFELHEAIALGSLVGTKIDSLSTLEQYQEIKLRIYLNLSSLCLNYQDYKNTKLFSTLAKQNAQTDYRLFELLVANLNYEIAQVADKKLPVSDHITKYLSILENLNYQETVNEYKKILNKSTLY